MHSHPFSATIRNTRHGSKVGICSVPWTHLMHTIVFVGIVGTHAPDAGKLFMLVATQAPPPIWSAPNVKIAVLSDPQSHLASTIGCVQPVGPQRTPVEEPFSAGGAEAPQPCQSSPKWSKKATFRLPGPIPPMLMSHWDCVGPGRPLRNDRCGLGHPKAVKHYFRPNLGCNHAI